MGAPADSTGVSEWLEIIVPVRNEASRLPAGLAQLCQKAATLRPGAAILVVDSASTDTTAEIVRQWPAGPVPVRMIHVARPGKGAAVRAGLLATRAPLVGFCDVDMATDLSALDVAVGLLDAGHPVVIGSRAHWASVVQARHSVLRVCGASLFRRLARLIAPGVSDTQCGFKFFSGPVARAAAAAMSTVGYAFDIELLVRCQALGAEPTEIPVRWRDVPGSSFSVWRHSGSTFADLARIWVSTRPSRRTATEAPLLPEPTAMPSATTESARVSPVDGLCVAVVNWRDPWHPEAGGAEQYAWEMARGLLARGARVCYLTARAPGQAHRECRDGVDIVRVGGRWTVYPLVLAWMAFHRKSFDAVVDCQNGIPFFTPWVLPRRVPVLCVMHHVHDAQFGVHFSPALATIGRFLEGPVSRWSYRQHECVAVSVSTVAAMRRRLGWTGPIHVVPNGLAPAAFTVPAAEAATTVPGPGAVGEPEKLRLIWVGRLVAHKRAERVLTIAERLGRDRITIDIVGRGPASGSLADKIAACGLQNTVRLRGYLTEDAKRTAVAASVLHLNTSQGEGWGLCVLEAAALGVPTVAYDVDGLRDAVRHGETGWLVGADERIEDVTERALKELADPSSRAEIARACRAWAAQFDWDRSAEQFAELIAAAVVSRRPPSQVAPDAAS